MGHARKQAISFFLTTRCNLGCRYCYTPKLDVRPEHRALDLRFAQLGIDDVVNGSTGDDELAIRYYGVGEPTLELGLMAAIHEHAARASNGRLQVELQTNGVFSRQVRDWVDEHVDILWISCDGPAELQDRFRPGCNGAASSPVVYANIEHFAARAGRVPPSGRLQLGVRATLTTASVARQVELVELFHGLGVKAVSVEPASPVSGASCPGEVSLDVDPLEFARCFAAAYRRAEELGMTYLSLTMVNFDEPVAVIQNAGRSPRTGGPRALWSSLDELGRALQAAYSVTDMIRQQYVDQVSQYPLYLPAQDRVIERIDRAGPHLCVVEYGPGPGILARRIAAHAQVDRYVAIEPEATFREMTRESVMGDPVRERPAQVEIIGSTAEAWRRPGSADLVVATATYHHFECKPLALANIAANLRPGGELVLMDVFFRDYELDAGYQPRSRVEFVERVLECATAQILAMPRATEAHVVDQMRTAFLDILQIEEMKVCTAVLLDQLRVAGLEDVRCELMELPRTSGEMTRDARSGDGWRVDTTVSSLSLGYYFVTARVKGGRGRSPAAQGDHAADPVGSRSGEQGLERTESPESPEPGR